MCACSGCLRDSSAGPTTACSTSWSRVWVASPWLVALAFDHGGDCGIFNVTTLEHARRRGLGTALVALQMHDALERGCETASLQSTPMAERVYAAVGFRDLGRILEYVP